MTLLQDGKTFDEIQQIVATRAAKNLPDVVVPLAEVAMLVSGSLVLPDRRAVAMTPWSQRQLASLLGVRWDRWFEMATPEERADEVNRRLRRMPVERKLRLTRDTSEVNDGVIRAFLGPGFTPIDDHRVIEAISATVRLDEFRFVRIDVTDRTSQYAAVSAEAIELGTGGKSDLMLPGFQIRNSEVGFAALTVDCWMWRLHCSNGLILPVGGRRLLYRTHRAIADEKLAAVLVIALAKVPRTWSSAAETLRRAKSTTVEDVGGMVDRILDDPLVPRSLAKVAREVVLADEDRTRFGVAQAITSVAHVQNHDPEVRFTLERLAGEWLAAA
ncbi:MAG: hypothetical protein IT379_24240 [Deltaproteobacteria bacterium]|nr:hypothetical protein [Deltaproteobacteria bacterium]